MKKDTKESQEFTSEKEIEHQILDWINRQEHCFAWKINNVGVWDEARKCYRKPNSPFIINGVSDIVGAYRGFIFCIEVKKPGGKRSDEQKAFIKKIQTIGGFACFSESLIEAQAFKAEMEKTVSERLGLSGEQKVLEERTP
jgi:hypothetical protein